MNYATAVALSRAQQTYNKGIAAFQSGDLENAILAFQECSFFSPDNANPEAAIAECYVYLCDIHSAVRHYRRALWLITRRRREAVRRAERKRGASLLLFTAVSPVPHFLGDDPLPEGFDKSQTSPEAKPAGATVIISIPDTLEVAAQHASLPAVQCDQEEEDGDNEDTTDMSATSKSTNEGGKAGGDFLNDQGITKSAVVFRLVGLLDALGIVLFRMQDFLQALRCMEEANELLSEASLPPIAPLEVHRITYLMALQREEEAEYVLENYMTNDDYSEMKMQMGALLVQLYTNRQAFQAAKELLERLEQPCDHAQQAAIRHEEALAIARHMFLQKYKHYREKAIEQGDMGTISKCINVHPSDTELLFKRAQLLIAAGDHKKSVKDLFSCIKESNGNHKEAIETMTSVLFTIGATLDGTAGMQEAVAYYTESLKWRKDNILVLLARGDCYVKMEDYEKALQDYQRVLDLSPAHEEAAHRLSFLHDLWGRQLQALGRPRDAEAEFTNAIKTNDQEPLFYYHRAMLRFSLDEERYGLRDVLSCQALNPADPRLRAFIVRYLGSDEVPDTSGSATAARQTPQGVQALRSKQDGGASARRAANLYGRPSARITKELESQQDPTAPAPSPHTMASKREEGAAAAVVSGRRKPLAKTTYNEFKLTQQKEEDPSSLTLLTGAKTQIHQRKPTYGGASKTMNY
ncbi:tetratricopeptide repeat protein 16 [Strigomonas culicis]|uniref:Tetratricopeptide repeat protein 16 n=1 Tax=Strigomonas culicis TaxID=28005 RepID=S9UFT7_9TRYP|nr:tetratricopeptide repeat protein 16 [Strigomonas culicis]|eukprot:EPY27579.1 tetratricopeptide repeat protein 16 [Strigomonas culicis]